MDAHRNAEELFYTLERLLDSMIDHQRGKVFKTAQRLRPNITEDDVMDPHSIPEIAQHPGFAYEDGQLAGLVSARVALSRDGAAYLRQLFEKQ
ncbi:MAG: hypothetical protein PWP23_1985 [Candidatus Sumerlaeota bacterium]|nr:hypothetical protein [Candidatus Sumerlaeota bacterium]